MNDRDPNHFFASQNTCEGFRCYFDTVFSQDSLKELWIVKGGPGTGKSHLMRSLARAWQEQGHRVELFACSSDMVLFVLFCFQIVEGAVPFPAVAMEGRHDLEVGFAGG